MGKHNVKEISGSLALSIAKSILILVCCFGLLMGLTMRTRAASWMDPYLEQVVDWGVMAGDKNGNLHPDRQITRAEFVTMINRAFGHKEVGPNPFRDVPGTAWYAEDIAIAYRAGYFAGTSATTASPNAPVTREQAVTMLGRNMRMQGGTGAILSYTDNTAMANWSRGMIQEATDMGIVSGYEDGSFRPRAPISRGEAAAIIVQAVGTLISEPGEQSVGGVYGNLTINTPGITLKDTVVTGNLYLSGGVGLENVVLENVRVMGKIIVCGAGVSQKGENSIILRNVTAQSLEIDSMTNQLMSVRAEGLTDIKETTVRTSAYVEDLTDDGLGLQFIKLDGTAQTSLQLAGNIKEVLNITPESALSIGQGVADKVTVDERAQNSTLHIDDSAYIRDLNLDTGTSVSGSGDIGNLSVNANGSVLPMLPDHITIRPGVSADINGVDMDSNLAAESSEDPRLLAGYPDVRNVGPKAADTVFSTNKSGTIYWALTALSDGSVGEDALVNPANYSAKIIKSGTIQMPASKTEMTAKLSGLTVDGSYYVSAILVDSRDRRSPVKVTAFTTPDDTVPNFAAGYPYAIMSEDGNQQVVQAMVMPTKDCQLYYALLPKGSSAPSAADFKAAAVTGNLGYGMMDVKKNTQHLIPKVNASTLKEQTPYDLYLWLNDADNGKSSAVKKLTVTTLDRTPPVLQHLTVTDMTAKSVSMTYSLDEPGTLYWAVVKRGTPFYANGITDPEDRIAKIQVESGTGALKRGNSSASKGATDVRFNISGLEPQTAYDLYYVAKDKAGNYNIYTKELTPPMEISTLDSEGPTVEQEFTHDGTDSPGNLTPYPDTSIRLVFSESVQGIQDVNGTQVYSNFLELYQTAVSASGDEKLKAEKALGEALKAHIGLYYKPFSGQPEQVKDRMDGNSGEDWVIDYRKAVVELDPSGSGKMIITFPHNSEPVKSGLNLASGATYYFELKGIADTSPAANRMEGSRGVTKLQEFTTIDAQMIFSRGSSTGTLDGVDDIVFDMNFRLTPETASSVEADVKWDLLFWSKSNAAFTLYHRNVGDTLWQEVCRAEFKTTIQTPEVGLSFTREADNDKVEPYSFARLRDAKDGEYGIVVTKLNGDTEREHWSGAVSIDVMPVAGDEGSLSVLANSNLTPENYKSHQAGIYKVKEIGVPAKYTVSCPFRDKVPPIFIDGYPKFEPGDSGANMDIQLSRNNAMYYYVVTEVGNIFTKLADKDETVITDQNWNLLPENGLGLNQDPDPLKQPNVSLPNSGSITNPPYSGTKYVIGSGKYKGGVQTIPIDGLKASTKYVAYFVLQGESQESISDVYAFRFETKEVVRPVLRVSLSNPSATVSSVGENPKEANVKYMMIVAGQEGSTLNQKMSTCWNDAGINDAGLDPVKDKATIEKYKNMSLIEAMETSVMRGSYSLGSVFDLFALPAKQEEVSAWFNSAGSNGTSIMLTGDTKLDRNNKLSSTVNCKDAMNKDNANMEYWFVAMGQSPLGSGYAFSAARYLFYPDNTPPQVITLTTSVKKGVQLEADPIIAANKGYSGTVTVTFSNALYYKKDSSTYLQVVDKPPVEIVGSPEYVSSAVLIRGENLGIKHQDKGALDNPTCRALFIEFTNIRQDNQIVFNENISNSRGITGNYPLTLTMKLVKNEQGLWAPQFEVSSPGWGNP